MRRRDDSFPALDKRAFVVKLGACVTLIGAVTTVVSMLLLRNGDRIWIVFVYGAIGVSSLIYGVSTLVTGWTDYRRYRRLLRDGDRDSWDPKTEPAEYGPWRPGDP